MVRYVDSTGTIQERLVSVVICEEFTGKAFVQIASEVMLGLNLDHKNCFRHSTDCAANMQVCYKGFNTLLSKEAPMQIHVWHHTHVVNLVVTEATSVVVTSTSLF